MNFLCELPTETSFQREKEQSYAYLHARLTFQNWNKLVSMITKSNWRIVLKQRRLDVTVLNATCRRT
ncbi:unnamed protein product [Cuscuta campestris]|uniref:Uncharacterized protein n=1 Tax=Cuscuta campestris TaxID=132261 RepID=A0A484ML91_9ASTE|nr:unnamed protein product [Cuscuta campestris]